MCNSSSPIDNSTSTTDETLRWFMYCICQGHIGSLIIIIISVLFLIVGTPIHCYSLWLLLHGNIRSLVFALNITITELIFCIQICVDLIAIGYFSIASFHLSLFLNALCWTVRPLLQICVCIEHYLAVIHPLTFLIYKGIRYKIALVTAAWLIGLGNGLRLIFIYTDLFPDHIFFIIFGNAVTITSYCCVSVLRALKRSGPVYRENVEMKEKNRHYKTDRGRAVENQQKRKALRIISHILVSILICYLPQVVAYITLVAEISKETYFCYVFPLSLSITVITVVISPLIYMYNEGHLKHIMCLSKLRG